MVNKTGEIFCPICEQWVNRTFSAVNASGQVIGCSPCVSLSVSAETYRLRQENKDIDLNRIVTFGGRFFYLKDHEPDQCFEEIALKHGHKIEEMRTYQSYVDEGKIKLKGRGV